MTELRDVAASVKQRLLNLARAQSEELQLVLTRYAIERLLYRLSLTPHAEYFVLKGATLFSIWIDEPHRATRDVDLLGYGAPDVERLERLFRELCVVKTGIDDGLDFKAPSVAAHAIREDHVYDGIRVRMTAELGSARIPLQIDVGFGDTVVPEPLMVTLPSPLNLPPATLRAYSRETVVAEKLEAMVVLGISNSRMKDFYDLWLLARRFDFKGPSLVEAVSQTFARRRSILPSIEPIALTEAFAQDSLKATQWRAFVQKGKLLEQPISLDEVVLSLGEFLLPVLKAARRDRRPLGSWAAGGPWSK